jgi:hypothetical protein
MTKRKPSKLWATGASSIHSLAAPVTKTTDPGLSRNEDLKEELLLSPRYNDRLLAEVKCYTSVLDRLLPLSGPGLELGLVCRAICEALMSVGLVVCDKSCVPPALSLSTNYERCPPNVVLLFAVLEVVYQNAKQGRSDDECLSRALQAGNWRPLEPLPREIRPLVRKAQREFPVSLVRKMPAEFFWFVSKPRLVEQGLIKFVPGQLSFH